MTTLKRPGRGPGAPFGSRPSPFWAETNPIVLRVDANAARVAGGTTVTITGQNFQSNAQVFFGSAPSLGVTVVDRNTITATVPAVTVAGVVDITVRNGSQSGVLPAAFTYYAGQIVSVTPNHCITAGGVRVVIQGYNFLNGSTISFGGIPATNVVFRDTTQFTCTVPAYPNGAGPVDVVITEP